MIVQDRNVLNFSVLFAGMNVNHNIITLDGKGTFHGMGMVAALTPKRKTTHHVKRKKVSEINVLEIANTDIIEYQFATHTLQNVRFEKHPSLGCCEKRVDILWEHSLYFQKPTPNGQGMMHESKTNQL